LLTFALRFRVLDRTLTENDASAAREVAIRRAAERVGAPY
jgi:phenylalanyl-tRNA synthetase beta chain